MAADSFAKTPSMAVPGSAQDSENMNFQDTPCLPAEAKPLFADEGVFFPHEESLRETFGYVFHTFSMYASVSKHKVFYKHEGLNLDVK